MPRCLNRLTRKRASSLPMTWAKSAPPVSSSIFLSFSRRIGKISFSSVSCVRTGRVHLLDDAAEPHHPRQAGLQVQVGPLVQHDGAEQLVDLRLAGNRRRRPSTRLGRVDRDRAYAERTAAEARSAVGAWPRCDSCSMMSASSGVRATMLRRHAGPAPRAPPGTPSCPGSSIRCSGRYWPRAPRRPRPRTPAQVLGLTGPAAGDDRDAHRRG